MPGVHVALELRSRLLRLKWLFRNDTHEVLVNDDLHDTRHSADRAFVDVHECGPDFGRAHDCAVHHVWQPHVVHELERSGDHRGHVDTPHRLYRGRASQLADVGALGLQRDVEFAAGDQIAERHALCTIGAGADHAVSDRELFDRDVNRVDASRSSASRAVAAACARLRVLKFVGVD